MVCIETINNMVEDNFDEFQKDSDRFKGMKLLIDFKPLDLSVNSPEMEMPKPKFKKRQITSKFIKPNPNKKSLF
jgi:hypothetical protein|tara:strand:+ start:337 stop:558 length:222 start_codon:yes stop_codon:yes gene_type:complete